MHTHVQVEYNGGTVLTPMQVSLTLAPAACVLCRTFIPDIAVIHLIWLLTMAHANKDVQTGNKNILVNTYSRGNVECTHYGWNN